MLSPPVYTPLPLLRAHRSMAARRVLVAIVPKHLAKAPPASLIHADDLAPCLPMHLSILKD
jgi:hypothetical protein